MNIRSPDSLEKDEYADLVKECRTSRIRYGVPRLLYVLLFHSLQSSATIIRNPPITTIFASGYESYLTLSLLFVNVRRNQKQCLLRSLTRNILQSFERKYFLWHSYFFSFLILVNFIIVEASQNSLCKKKLKPWTKFFWWKSRFVGYGTVFG